MISVFGKKRFEIENEILIKRVNQNADTANTPILTIIPII